jgi:hypothetical protein
MKINTNLLTPNDQVALLVLTYEYSQAAVSYKDVKDLAKKLIDNLGRDYCANLFFETAKRLNVDMPEVVTSSLLELE